MDKTNSFLPTIWFSNLVFHFQWISRPRLVFDEYTVKFCSFSKSTWSRISTVPWPLPFRSIIIIGNYQCHCHTHWIVIGDYPCHWREPDVPASVNNRSQGRGVALKLKLSRFKSSFFQIFCFSLKVSNWVVAHCWPAEDWNGLSGWYYWCCYCCKKVFRFYFYKLLFSLLLPILYTLVLLLLAKLLLSLLLPILKIGVAIIA